MSLFDLFKKKKVRTKANVNTSNPKEDIMKMMMHNMMQKTPSEHFASGAVFDITRQNHDSFAHIVNSNDAISLKNFFCECICFVL